MSDEREPIDCPWCDELPTVYEDNDSTGPIHVVECDCGVRAPAARECDGNIRKDAISNWNLLFEGISYVYVCDSCNGSFVSRRRTQDEHRCRGCNMVVCQSCCDFWDHWGEGGLHGSGDPQENAKALRKRVEALSNE